MILQYWCAMVIAAGLFTQSNVKPAAQPAAQQTPVPHNLRVSGTVLDGLTGQQLSQSQVFLTAQGVRDSQQFVLTGEDGRFAFENLAPGHYVLSANPQGLHPAGLQAARSIFHSYYCESGSSDR